MIDLSGRVVVVSPHLDDGVLSCGELIAQLADCVVLTVFAGSPGVWDVHRSWDHEACGFLEGTDVMAARHREDDRAVVGLGAAPRRLDFLDSQYRNGRPPPSAETIAAEVARAIEEIDGRIAIIPLGLGHDDHRLTASGCRLAVKRMPELTWFAYQDLPYAYEPDVIGPHGVDDALRLLAELDPADARLTASRAVDRKKSALEHYVSQMRALGHRGDTALKPERYWSLRDVLP